MKTIRTFLRTFEFEFELTFEPRNCVARSKHYVLWMDDVFCFLMGGQMFSGLPFVDLMAWHCWRLNVAQIVVKSKRYQKITMQTNSNLFLNSYSDTNSVEGAGMRKIKVLSCLFNP